MVRVHPAVPAEHLKSLHSFWPRRMASPWGSSKGSKEVPRVRRVTHLALHDDIMGYAPVQAPADPPP